MVRSSASTVDEYLNELPEDKRSVVSEVRELVLQNLPDGYEEAIDWGMISYQVPLARYPETYNGKPLTYLSLAAQKNYYALYLHNVYQDPEKAEWLKEQYERAGIKLDMGKSCLRFRRLDDLPREAIAQVVAGTTPEDFIAAYEASRKR
jgi:uncharacterized protein YdhG (YjbR/CyaY superfamily)